MDFSAINDLYIGSTPVQSAWLNGSKVWGRKPAVDEQPIRDAMVLWYDLKKQGATNESMAENPVLRDLSGNGHDATCYNFAWSGMSGVGGYADSYIKPGWYIENKRVTATKTEAKINVTGILSTTISIYYQSNADEQARLVPSYKIKVIGLTDGQSITYSDYDNTVTFMISNDGEYTLPEINFAAAGKFYGFVFNKLQDSCNITIEQLPLYPHALVSDGVDDYCLVEGLPLLNKDDGYTVIAKRKWIVTGLGAVCSKTVNNDGAFQLERVQGIVEHPNESVSFNQYLPITFNNDDVFVYQTTYNYNGVTELRIQDVLDTDRMSISAVITTFYSRYSGIALYSLLLFNRDLSTEEIEWVKTNLIETEQ